MDPLPRMCNETEANETTTDKVAVDTLHTPVKRDDQPSPTSVMNNDNGEKNDDSENADGESDNKSEGSASTLQFLDVIQANATKCIHSVQTFSSDLQSKIVVDRKTITTSVLSVLSTIVLLGIFSFIAVCGLALVTAPVWLPVALFTSPVWLPVLLLTSPVWLTALVVTATFFIGGVSLVLFVFFFFTWPQDWLPRSPASTKFLYLRNQATKYLVKFQAKLVLYAAGVGPLADAAFVILDRIDLQKLAQELQSIDLQELTNNVKAMNIQDLQQNLLKMIMGLFR